MNEKQLAKLIKKTTGNANRPAKDRPAKKYDPSLQNRPDHDNNAEERSQFFDEMKKREF